MALVVAALPLYPDLRAADSFAQLSTVLLLIAGTFLVYRGLRQKYLLLWLLGWCVFLFHKLAATFADAIGPLAVSHAAYALAIGLIGAGISLFAERPRLIKPLATVGLVGLVLALLRVDFLPESRWLAYSSVLTYATCRALAAVQLVKFARERRSLAGLVLAAGFLALNIHENSAVPQMVQGLDLFVELVVGVGMLLIAVHESQRRNLRLQAVNAITAVIADSRHVGPIIETALQQLKKLTGARAAWFRMLEGNQLVLSHSVGLSEDYVRACRVIGFAASYSGQVIDNGRAEIIEASQATEETRAWLSAEGFPHVLLVPVCGKNSIIGTLAFAVTHRRSHHAEEISFLSGAANQLGIGVENLRLFQQILRSQKQWISTFDSIEDCILVHDQDFRVLKVNRALLNRLSSGPTAVVNRSCAEVLPQTADGWRDCPYCWRVVSKFGETADPCFGGYSQVSSSSYVDQESGVLGTIHIIKDITELRAKEENYRRFFEQMQEGVFISTPEGRLLDCNEALVQMLGYESREELLARDIGYELYVDPAQRDLSSREMAQRGSLRNYEVKLRRRDGSTVVALETSFASRDASGAIVRYQGILLDITEKKRADDEVHRRNRELAALNAIAVVANSSFDLQEILEVTLRQVVDLFSADTGAVYLVDQKAGRLRRHAAYGEFKKLAEEQSFELPEELLRASDARLELLTPGQLGQLPRSVAEFVAAEGLRSWMWVLLWTQNKLLGVLAASSRRPDNFGAGDQHLMVALGRQLATTIHKVHLYEETRLAYEHITRAQEQLLQSEKMSAIGRLVSGVAHELNNPLTAILGYAQLLEGEGLDARPLDYVQKIYKQTQRTHRIVQNLLSFSRQRKAMKQPLDMRRVAEDTLSLREYDLRLHNIAVEKEFASELPEIIGDSHQLEQVFLNIINNAADAILENSRFGTLRVRIHARESDVCVQFADTGPGFAEPQRIFDPFYTTKIVGKGTGLGLSICYGIVKEHGGDILAHNDPGGGAVIEIRLPAISPAQVVGSAAGSSSATASSH